MIEPEAVGPTGTDGEGAGVEADAVPVAESAATGPAGADVAGPENGRLDLPASVGNIQREALVSAALALVDDGATARELAGRFGDAAATIDAELCRSLLDELSALGLVRVAHASREPRFVVTSLGAHAVDTGVADSGLDEQLRELEWLRTDLISTVSHELRTPLTAIRTCVGLLLDPATEPDEAEQRILLSTIERNADRMQRLVADVLDLARYRAGHVQLQLRRFDARSLAREAVTTIRPLAEARGQTIRLVVSDEPVPVFGDHRRLEQAVLNLLSNAQKFSPPGAEIRVEVADGDGEVSWSVRDEGPGIPVEDQARLFERFFVGRSDRGGPTGGTGLGLPTALAIAQAHGGRIEVTSAPAAGSLFVLRIPAEGLEPEEL